jgi:hypothetical protein
MQYIFGEHLLHVFTPPWNRLSSSTLRILQQLEFKAVSLSGPFPRGTRNPIALKNIRINLDLHTRKSKDARQDFKTLLEEIAGIHGRKEPCGIMIHHHRMTPFAFEFLDELLFLLKNQVRAHFLSFKDILQTVK